MIISVEKLRTLIKTNESDKLLALKLNGIEKMIRTYTNNNFQNRNIRGEFSIVNNIIIGPLKVKNGDTLQISNSLFNNDSLVVVDKLLNGQILIDDELNDEDKVLVTKVEYPQDVIMGVVNLMNWEVVNRAKVGIKSESISRHSVTYFDLDSNSLLGYPKSLLNFLDSYKKARF